MARTVPNTISRKPLRRSSSPTSSSTPTDCQSLNRNNLNRFFLNDTHHQQAYSHSSLTPSKSYPSVANHTRTPPSNYPKTSSHACPSNISARKSHCFLRVLVPRCPPSLIKESSVLRKRHHALLSRIINVSQKASNRSYQARNKKTRRTPAKKVNGKHDAKQDASVGHDSFGGSPAAEMLSDGQFNLLPDLNEAYVDGQCFREGDAVFVV